MIQLLLILFLSADEVPVSTIDLESHGILSFDLPMAISPDGHIGILDTTNYQVVIIDPEGKLHAKAGRKGKGPGEFAWMSFITWSEEHNGFAAFDYGNHRVSIWNKQGKLVKEYKIYASIAKGYLAGSKNLIVGLHTRGLRKRTPGLYKVELADAMSKPNKLWEASLDKPLAFNDIAGRPSVFKWDARMVFAAGEGFLAVNFNQSDTIDIIDFNGKKLADSIQPELPRYKLTDEAIKSVMDTFPPGTTKPSLGKMIRPEYWPTISQIQIDSHKRIWVFGYPQMGEGPQPYQVISMTGEVIKKGIVDRIPKFVQNNKIYFMSSDIDEDSKVFIEIYDFKQ